MEWYGMEWSNDPCRERWATRTVVEMGLSREAVRRQGSQLFCPSGGIPREDDQSSTIGLAQQALRPKRYDPDKNPHLALSSWELPSDTSESHRACLSRLNADSLGRAALTSAIT